MLGELLQGGLKALLQRTLIGFGRKAHAAPHLLNRLQARARFTKLRRIDAELSRRIALAPHAWPWMHPRWSNVTMD